HLRLFPSVRGLCAEGETQARLFRAAGAGRRRDRGGARSQDRPPEQEAPDAEVELGREGYRAKRPQGVEAEDRGRTRSFRAVSARRFERGSVEWVERSETHHLVAFVEARWVSLRSTHPRHKHSDLILRSPRKAGVSKDGRGREPG